MAIKRIENIYDVTHRLLGEIEPQGETNIDAVRFENLKDTTQLLDEIIEDVVKVAGNKNRYEASMKKAGHYADSFLSQLNERLKDHFKE